MSTSAEKKDQVQRVETAVNNQDHDLIDDIFAEDVVVSFHGGREELTGVDEFKAYLDRIYSAFPDLTISLKQLVGEDDLVAVRFTGTGTHEGEYNGIAPTGEEVELSGMRFCRLEDGKVAEVWGQRDDLGLLVQLGIVEPPEG